MNRASTIIQNVIDDIQTPITFGEFMAKLQDKGFALLIIAASLVVLIPTPPGLNFFSGLFVLVWAVQRVLGKQTPWMPRFVRNKEVSPEFLRFIRDKGVPYLVKLERFLPKTSAASMANPFETKAASVILLAMAVLTVMPTPFLNTIPAAVITLVGLGMLNGNRYIIWTSFFAGLVASAIIVNVLWFSTDFLLGLF
ncbi:MAG TPA: exopolysaccharide biosynthesis protein [Firmicutes bacterium]|nr:MAG: hypothetical protein AA931_09360 [Peptococcaceae bacterium 1109]HHT73643.1 exopolysaccharide biosynthesis protein [Bacillota bacterium]